MPARKDVSGDEVAEVLALASAVLEHSDENLREVETRFERVRKAVAPMIRRAQPASAPSVMGRPK